MTTLLKALNKFENLLVELGADKRKAEDALETLSEVYEEKLATKEFVASEIKSLRQEMRIYGTLIGAGIIGLFLQNLVM